MTANGNGRPATASDVAATLQQVEEVRRRTRAVVHPASFPMLLFGAFALAATPFCALGGQDVFWALAGPVGGLLTARHYHRTAKATGAGVRGGPYWAVAAAIFAGAWLAGASGSPRVATAGPMLAVALGYLLFARLERSVPIAVCSAVLAVVAVAVGLAHVGHRCEILSLAFGTVFAAGGLLMRGHERG